jgi:hypothetical protein
MHVDTAYHLLFARYCSAGFPLMLFRIRLVNFDEADHQVDSHFVANPYYSINIPAKAKPIDLGP